MIRPAGDATRPAQLIELAAIWPLDIRGGRGLVNWPKRRATAPKIDNNGNKGKSGAHPLRISPVHFRVPIVTRRCRFRAGRDDLVARPEIDSH